MMSSFHLFFSFLQTLFVLSNPFLLLQSVVDTYVCVHMYIPKYRNTTSSVCTRLLRVEHLILNDRFMCSSLRRPSLLLSAALH